MFAFNYIMKFRFFPQANILVLISALFCIAVSCTENYSRNKIRFDRDDLTMADTIIDRKFRASAVPGLAVGLVLGDQTFVKTLGFSNQEQRIPYTDSTVFCTGVLSEVLTSMLALALNQHHHIGLEEPVLKYLPHFSLNSNSYKHITIRHLLTQTSGVPRHSLFWDFPNMGDSALWQTTWSIRLQEPEFEPPGVQIVRSPYNFDILADLIEHASKSRFEDFVSRHVFQPLQMGRSSYCPDSVHSDRYAKPHFVQNWLTYQNAVKQDYPLNREHAGSMGWHTTVQDATKWMSMLLNHGKHHGEQVLKASLVKEFLSPAYKTDQAGSFMGLGWEIKTINGTLVFIKAGEIGGFDNALVFIPEFKMGALVSVNAQSDFQPALFAQELLFSLKTNTLPDYQIPVYLEMGKILESTGSIGKAIDFYKQAKADSRKYDCFDLMLSQFGSNLFYRMGREREALAVFELCRSEFLNSAYTHLNFAEYYLHQKDVEKTELELQVVERIAEQSHDIKFRVRLIKGALELLLEKANVDNNEAGKPEGNVNEICIPCEDEAKQQSTIAGAD